MKKTLLFVCLFGSASLAFAEDTATKTEVYTQVGDSTSVLLKLVQFLIIELQMSVKNLTIALLVSMFDLIKRTKI